MFVTDRRTVQGVPGTAGGVNRSTGPSSRFSLGASDTQRASSAGAAAPAASMDALLAVQASGDALERRKKAVRRGRALLDDLDQVKIALLSGRMPLVALLRLRQTLSDRRGEVNDPALDDILAQIELRAEVELAKMQKALPPSA